MRAWMHAHKRNIKQTNNKNAQDFFGKQNLVNVALGQILPLVEPAVSEGVAASAVERAAEELPLEAVAVRQHQHAAPVHLTVPAAATHRTPTPPRARARSQKPGARAQSRRRDTLCCRILLFSYAPGAVLCCAVLFCVVLCCVKLCCVVLYYAVLCCVVLCCVMLYCVVLCCVVLCCAVLYTPLSPLLSAPLTLHLAVLPGAHIAVAVRVAHQPIAMALPLAKLAVIRRAIHVEPLREIERGGGQVRNSFTSLHCIALHWH